MLPLPVPPHTAVSGANSGANLVQLDQKITFGEMRAAGADGVVVFCRDYKCTHSIKLSADRWPDQLRLSDIEPQFVCKACGKRGADVRPDYQGARQKPASLRK